MQTAQRSIDADRLVLPVRALVDLHMASGDGQHRPNRKRLRQKANAEFHRSFPRSEEYATKLAEVPAM